MDPTDYPGPERRHAGHRRHDDATLSDAQMKEIIERAVVRAREEFYREVGRNVVEKLLVLLGMAAVAVTVWLARNDLLK